MPDRAWKKQSESLVEVQQKGAGLEKLVREVLDWRVGRISYDVANGYNIQVDGVFPTTLDPETVVSVTYTNPDTPGHSNENKLHLKLGELALLKFRSADIRVALVIGATRRTWLPYVLKVFEIFFDEVIYLATKQGRERLRQLAEQPLSVPLRNCEFWGQLRRDWSTRMGGAPLLDPPPKGLLRYRIADLLRSELPAAHPSQIQSEIARVCLQRSSESSGREWESYVARRWNRIEMSRNYFNPNEAAVELTLQDGGFKFDGGIAEDVSVHSLLHDLGFATTRLSEDFRLTSTKLRQPVYIQCKASGGGRRQHGKNIQNRAKEQLARSIFYTCTANASGDLQYRRKNFHWIGVLDGDWGVTRSQPLKYVRMLQLAGYDAIFCADLLVDGRGNLKSQDNLLAGYLSTVLGC